MTAALALLLKESNATVLCNFLGEDITRGDAKKFFAIISYDLWNGIVDNDDDKMMKEKVINFLNPFCIVKNVKEIFTFK